MNYSGELRGLGPMELRGLGRILRPSSGSLAVKLPIERPFRIVVLFPPNKRPVSPESRAGFAFKLPGGCPEKKRCKNDVKTHRKHKTQNGIETNG